MNRPFVHEMFLDRAHRHPERVAVATPARSLTYGELAVRSARAASALEAAGIDSGSVVAVATEDPGKLAVAVLGTMRAGCAFLAVDLELPPSRIRSMFEEAPPACLLAPSGLREEVAEIWSGRRVELDRLPDDGLPDGEARPRGGDELAYVVFTSGSTGRPKPIAGRLRAIDHFVRWEISALGVAEEWRVSHLTSPAFDAVLRDLFVPLGAGGTVCAPASRSVALDGPTLARWVEDERIDLLHCVPSLFRMLLEGGGAEPRFLALRYVLLAGEVLLPADVRRWTEIHGPRTRLVNLYGPSETTMTKLVHFVGPEDGERARVPIGRAMPGTDVAVLDSRGRPSPVGTIGEIYVRTPYRTLGYLDRPELTREVFVANPLTEDPADVVYRTGDLGRMLEDGSLEFLGRKDGQVKIRGVRVEISEVEGVLREHPAVRDVAVVAREDAHGYTSLHAYVVTGGEGAFESLREFVARRLPDAMVPSLFLSMERLPRTHTGKIDRRALPSADSPSVRRDRSTRGARTHVEALLCEQWAEVLGLERVGVDESFFELGGHSLLATRLLSRLRRSLGVEIDLQTLFEAPTVERLADRVEIEMRGGGSGPPAEIPRVSRDRPQPLSVAQQRLWIVEQLHPDSSAYHVSTGLHLAGRLELGLASRALQCLADRHEALRTSFGEDAEGQPLQRVAPRVALQPLVVDLQGLAREVQDVELERVSAQEMERLFDLSRAPLLRVVLVREAALRWVVLLTIHHIVSDDWSIELLISEFAQLYTALREDRDPHLPELPVQYVDFSAWQHGWLRDGGWKEHGAFWRRYLSGSPPVLALPTDRPRPESSVGSGGRRSFVLSRELVGSLRELCRKEGVTPYMAMLAVFAFLMGRYSGQDDLVVGSAYAGRDRPGTEGLVGFFVNMLPVRLSLADDRTYRELLRDVRSRILAVFAHRELPFQSIVEEVGAPRLPGVSPLVQVAFGFRDIPVEKPALGDLEAATFPRRQDGARFDLTLWVTRTGDGLEATWSYRSDILEPTTVDRMHGELEGLLQRALARPDTAVGRLWSEAAGPVAEGRAGGTLSDVEKQGRLREIAGARRRKGVSIPAEGAAPASSEVDS